MIFDATVVSELRSLCDHAPPELAITPSDLETLTVEELRYHLLRSLEPPPENTEEGYRLLRELAQNVGVNPAQLHWALRQRDGTPRRRWRLSTGPKATQKLRWLLMREGGFIAIGKDEVGDLSLLPTTADGKALLRDQLIAQGMSNAKATKDAVAFHAFAHEMTPGDLVVAMDGSRAVGIGRIQGDYSHVNDRSLAHRRAVDWLTFEEVPLPTTEPQSVLQDLSPNKEALLLIEAALLRARTIPVSILSPEPTAPPPVPALAGLHAEIDAALHRKGQVILTGPPGTGKTYGAERAAMELAARSWFNLSLEQLSGDARRQLTDLGSGGLGAVESCCFHPSFGYEDFIEGLRPQVHQGHLVFEQRDGLFKRLCRRALLNPGRDFFLLIDELNRGDIPRIFGDLLSIIDQERRGTPITLPLSGERLSVPTNVFIIATMNSADRSISPLDTALRRRFAVIELHPDSTILQRATLGRINLGRLLDTINERILEQDQRAGLDARIGHAFFLRQGRPIQQMKELAQVLQQEIFPTLREHLLGDLVALENLIGSTFVDRTRGRLVQQFFFPGNEAHLETALLEAFPGANASQ